MFSGFLRGSAESQSRVLRRVGLATVAAVVAGYLVIGYLVPALSPDDESVIEISLDTPYVGPGVDAGTKVVLRGANVGTVVEVVRDEDGGITLDLELEKNLVAGVRQDFTMDFRPSNYFGITALMISDPGVGPVDIGNGDHITSAPGGDYTMSKMIEQGSQVANGSLTDSTMESIDRVLEYTKALSPLLHTGVVVADTVARTQREMPAELIAKFNNIVDEMPTFSAGAIDGIYAIFDSGFLYVGDDIRDRMTSGLDAIATKFFAMVGTLLGSNEDNFFTTTEIIRNAAGVLPAMLGGGFDGASLSAIVDRVDSAFQTQPDGGKSLNVQVTLDLLPGMQSVLGSPATASGER